MDISGRGMLEDVAGRLYGAAGASGAWKMMSHSERSALAGKIAAGHKAASGRMADMAAGRIIGAQLGFQKVYPGINQRLTAPGMWLRGGGLGRNRGKIIIGGAGVGAASGAGMYWRNRNQRSNNGY